MTEKRVIPLMNLIFVIEDEELQRWGPARVGVST